ncbi:MAG TPA: ABC transporter permease [Baekduia sp.]
MPPTLETASATADATATTAGDHDAQEAVRSRRHPLADLAVRHSILVLIVLLFVLFSILQPDTFPTGDNLRGVALGQAVSALLALSVLVVVVTGEFDLSVGYVIGFAGVLAAKLTGDGMGGALALVLTLAAGTAIGALNGILVSRFRVNSLIATLGVGLAVSGLSVGVSGGQTLSEGVSTLYSDMARTSVLGLQTAIWSVLVVGVILYVVLIRTPLGRKMYATGGSERVARMVGIRTRLLKTGAFAVAGLIAALAGALQLGLSGAANPSYGSNLLLPAFAAVFLGSTTVRPGSFNVWGTVLAILLLAIGFSGLSLLGVPFWVEPVFQGVALVLGVLLSRSETRASLAAN